MAFYTYLKGLIANVVKNNGKGSITGDLLQQELFRLLDGLTCFKFVGLANSRTIPSPGDEPLMYLASEKGVFEGFDNIEVNEDICFLCWSGSSWVKITKNIDKKDYNLSELKDTSIVIPTTPPNKLVLTYSYIEEKWYASSIGLNDINEILFGLEGDINTLPDDNSVLIYKKSSGKVQSLPLLFNNLYDVAVGSPQDWDILMYNGGEWFNRQPIGSGFIKYITEDFIGELAPSVNGFLSFKPFIHYNLRIDDVLLLQYTVVPTNISSNDIYDLTLGLDVDPIYDTYSSPKHYGIHIFKFVIRSLDNDGSVYIELYSDNVRKTGYSFYLPLPSYDKFLNVGVSNLSDSNNTFTINNLSLEFRQKISI